MARRVFADAALSVTSPPDPEGPPSLRHDEGRVIGVGGRSLYVQRWRPPRDPRAIIVLVHGLGEHSGRYTTLVERLLARGFGVDAFDHRGHGRSEGRRADIESMDTLAADVRSRIAAVRADHPGRPLVLLGHSMGGAVALWVAMSDPALVDALVLSAPAVGADPSVPPLQLRMARLLARLWPGFGIHTLDPATVSRDPGVVRAYGADPLVHHGALPARTVVALLDAMRAFEALVAGLRVPVLVMHGTADRLVPLAHAETVYRALGAADCTVLRYAGLAHELFNEPEQASVYADLEAWLDARF